MRLAWKSLPAAAVLLTAQATAGAVITNSVHDFRPLGWSPDRICIACHTPHESDAPPDARRYPLYGRRSTQDETVVLPGASSKLCLSCHDGVISTDRSDSPTGAMLAPGLRNLDNTLINHHPVGFLYDKAIRTAYASLFDPRAKTVTIGTGEQSKSGSIESVLLFDGKVECLSCHDAHNTFTVGPLRLLKNPADGRAICLSCHVK